jgi:twitching motility protein PilT
MSEFINQDILSDRRGTFRLFIHINFKYKILSLSENKDVLNNALTKNISDSGLLFENSTYIPLDTEVKIILNLPGVLPLSIEIGGKVVRIEKLSSSFEIGINFINLTEKQKNEIKTRVDRMNILKLLERVNKKEISDLHLTVNSPPMVRCYGQIQPLDDDILSAEEIEHMIYSILTEEQRRILDSQKDLDFSFSPSLDSRYRVSIYKQRGVTEIVFRNILPDIKSRRDLGLPEVVEDLCQLKDGLIIIGGTTGSGKSTTISTMIDIINRTRGGVVLSLEKPIEYLHKNIKAIVKQREVGTDVPSFATGLRASLRQDADVIVVGEILDCDSVEAVLQAAETGHLVITSLHATDVVQVFDRIISFFPPETRSYIYARLSHSLRALIIQRLLIHKSGIGRVLATEVCTVNMAVKRIINSGDFNQLSSVIQTGSQYKMHTVQESLDRLFEQGLINAETYEINSKGQVKK